MRYLVVLLCVVLPYVFGKIPSNFRKCNRGDSDFEKCFMETAQDSLAQLTKPVKELNLPSLEPFEIDYMKILSNGNLIALDQNFTNCKVSGLSTAKIHKIRLNLEQKTFFLNCTAPKVLIDCDYTMSGKLLLFTLSSHGNCTYIFNNYHIIADATFKEVLRNQKTFLKMADNKLDSEPDSLTTEYGNLFNGNKQLEDNLNQLMNENAKDIYKEVKGSLDDILGQIVTSLFDRVFNKVSVEELFD